MEENKVMICTVAELAEYIASKIDGINVLGKCFPACDFAITTLDVPKEYPDPEDIGSGWYGVKAIDAGFDSDNLILYSDYYGGGCANFAVIWDMMEDFGHRIADAIEKLLVDTLNDREVATPDTRLLVHLDPEPETT